MQLIAQADLIGKFCSPADMAVKCITFHADSTFEEQFHGCLESPINTGTYKILGNTLSLLFDDKDTSKNRYTEESIPTFQDNDSIDILAKISDAKSLEPLSFASVSLFGKNDSTYITDIDGNLHIKLKKKRQLICLEISYVGYHSFPIKLISTNSLKLNIFLAPHHTTIPNGTIWKYKITKDKAGRLILRTKQSNLFLSKIES